MFSRWRQENFFRYQPAHDGLDGLDAYETEPDDPACLVGDPAGLVADRAVRDAIRIATYNAQSALARLIALHHAIAEDEARSLVHEIFKAPADLQVRGDTICVQIHELSAPDGREHWLHSART